VPPGAGVGVAAGDPQIGGIPVGHVIATGDRAKAELPAGGRPDRSAASAVTAAAGSRQRHRADADPSPPPLDSHHDPMGWW
jgi:hypothetical protein